MKSRLAPVLVVATTLLAGAASAASRDNNTETIRVDRAALVAGSVIPAGTYQVELSGDMDAVRLVQGKRTVVEAPCTVALTPLVYPGNAVHYRDGQGGQDRLIKIVLADSKLAIEFPTDAAVATDGSAASAAGRR